MGLRMVPVCHASQCRILKHCSSPLRHSEAVSRTELAGRDAGRSWTLPMIKELEVALTFPLAAEVWCSRTPLMAVSSAVRSPEHIYGPVFP